MSIVADAELIIIVLLRLLRQMTNDAATVSRSEIRWATETYVAHGNATTLRMPSSVRGAKDEAMMKEATFDIKATSTPSIATDVARARTSGGSISVSWLVTIASNPWPRA